MIWEIDDKTHKIIGTSFNYRNTKKRVEELEVWLSRMIEPHVNFIFHETEIGNLKLVLFENLSAEKQPIKFFGEEHIRIGSNKKIEKPSK